MGGYSFKCEDVGMNCGFQVNNASSEDEILELLKVHARISHGLTTIPNEVLERIKRNIKRPAKYSFSCSSVGMNCGFEIVGASSVDEVLEELSIHAKMAHNLSQIPSDLLNRVRQNIKAM
jgi:predicted small metal-binding protein